MIDDQQAGVDFIEVLRALLRRWLLIFIIGTLFTAGAAAIAFTRTPIYRAEVTLIGVEDSSSAGLLGVLGNLGGVAAMAGIDVGARNDVEVSIATLRSDGFLSTFIEENRLLQEFFAKQWDSRAETWKVPEDAPTMMDGLRLLEDGVMSVSRDRRTGLITVAIEWHDRHKAAAWANLLVQRVNELLRKQAIEEAEHSIEFLNKELERTTVVDLRQAISRLTEAQINRIMMANVRPEFAFRVVDPATVPDAKYKVRPRRLVILMFGAFLGGAVGVLVALWQYFRPPVSKATA